MSNIIDDCKGHIVFIDNSDELITALRHEIRFVNITEYPIDNLCSFYGFISGLVAQITISWQYTWTDWI